MSGQIYCSSSFLAILSATRGRNTPAFPPDMSTRSRHYHIAETRENEHVRNHSSFRRSAQCPETILNDGSPGRIPQTKRKRKRHIHQHFRTLKGNSERGTHADSSCSRKLGSATERILFQNKSLCVPVLVRYNTNSPLLIS